MAELSTLARPYAKAAFNVASEQNGLANWSAMLSILATVTLEQNVATVLSNPQTTSVGKAKFLSELCAEQLDDAGKQFVNTLAENHRLPLLAEIFQQFQVLKAELEKSIDVTVTSAYELSEAQQNTLSEKLAAKLGCEVSITTTVDNSIIGGVIVRAKDFVIDGSVSGKLAKMAEAMNS